MKRQSFRIVSRRDFAGALAAAFTAVPIIAQCTEQKHVDKDVDWLSEVQCPPDEMSEDSRQLRPLLRDDAGRKISTRDGREERRNQVRQGWMDFLGPLDVKRPSPPTLKVLAEDRVEGVIRQLVRYRTEPGIDTEAYLLKPANRIGKKPAVAVFHSTVTQSILQPAGGEGISEEAFGLKLAQPDDS